MKKILFCQFHNYLINGKTIKNIADKYYYSIYSLKKNDGYYKTDEFFELPLWINEINGSLKNSDYKTELLIIDDIKKAIEKINASDFDYILFSALDVNKKFILEIIKKSKNKNFVLGGYIDFKDFLKFDNVKIFKSVKDFIENLNLKYVYNLDYTLFKNYKTIPRLTLSTGCLNKCKFCIVEKRIIKTSNRDIIKQVKAFKNLKFKLVYLNDKTFGQCNNYKLLPLIYKRIKKYNPQFEGFIIQTTAIQFLKKDFIENLKSSHIFACELGIESYNNAILKALRKPQTEKIINNAVQILKSLKIKIIPNLIIGLLNENKNTYNKTLNFIKKNLKDIYILNIYNLAIYLNSELSKEIKINDDNDLNENITKKSFYNSQSLKDNDYFYNQIFRLGLKILKQNN